MRRLSDFKGDEAMELWADLLEPLTGILGDPEVAKVVKSGKPMMLIASEILKSHKAEAVQIMQRIDDTPIDGLNIILRLVNLIKEIGENDTIKSFFGYAEQAKTETESSGSVMESIEDDGK